MCTLPQRQMQRRAPGAPTALACLPCPLRSLTPAWATSTLWPGWRTGVPPPPSHPPHPPPPPPPPPHPHHTQLLASRDSCVSGLQSVALMQACSAFAHTTPPPPGGRAQALPLPLPLSYTYQMLSQIVAANLWQHLVMRYDAIFVKTFDRVTSVVDRELGTGRHL